MNEELIEIYNAVKRSHSNMVSLLLEKILTAMAQHSQTLKELDVLTGKLIKMSYHYNQINTLRTIADLLKQHGSPKGLIDDMIDEQQKEIYQIIDWVYSYFLRHTKESPVPNYIIVRAKNFLGRCLPESPKYDEHGWPLKP